MDAFHKTNITLGLWGNDGWDFTIQLECINETLVSFVDVLVKLECAHRDVNVIRSGRCFQLSFFDFKEIKNHKRATQIHFAASKGYCNI